MASTRFLRYLAPNVITLSSMIFGLVSLWSTHNGNYPLAAWLVIYAVLTDRLDGLVARAVKGTSELGMQLDSFADFLNFGVAPAFLVLNYLTSRDDLPYHDRNSVAHTLLFVACGAYMLCAVFRLARYNVLSDDQIPTKMFFGFPTTLAGGMLMIWSSSSTIRTPSRRSPTPSCSATRSTPRPPCGPTSRSPSSSWATSWPRACRCPRSA
jgi:CDP-diacylglycerol--serine O-phosphatidyltransferase